MERGWLEERAWRLAGVPNAGIALSLLACGPAVAVLISESGHDEGRAAALGLFALAVCVGALLASIVATRQAEYLNDVARFFAPGPLRSLRDLAADPKWAPGGHLRDRDVVLITEIACALAVAIVFSASHPHGLVWLLAVWALLAAVVGLAVVYLVRKPKLIWSSTEMKTMADRMSRLRDTPDGELELPDASGADRAVAKRSGDDLHVLQANADPLPPPEYVARAFFGPGNWTRDRIENGWIVFKGPTGGPFGEIGATPIAARTLATRAGPLAAAGLMLGAAILLVVSILAGTAGKLPGWALGSPLLYEAARAAAALLGLTILANLLLALASGRLMSKVGKEGLELDAATALDVAAGDRKGAEAINTLEEAVKTMDQQLKRVARSANTTRQRVANHNELIEVLRGSLTAVAAEAEELDRAIRQSELVEVFEELDRRLTAVETEVRQTGPRE
jgi:hypothetical protein